MKFSFGHAERERIEVDVPECGPAPVNDYHWLTVRITVQAGGFQGEVAASILAEDLIRFLEQLRPLYESLSGTAEFSTLEGQLGLRLVGDGKGHIALTGEVADYAGIGNRLHFSLHFDQTQLRVSICQLERITSQIPNRVG